MYPCLVPHLNVVYIFSKYLEFLMEDLSFDTPADQCRVGVSITTATPNYHFSRHKEGKHPNDVVFVQCLGFETLRQGSSHFIFFEPVAEDSVAEDRFVRSAQYNHQRATTAQT